MTYSVGIDMGGTFTDGYFSDGERAVAAKVPTTHFDLTRSVMSCLAEGAGAFEISLADFLAEVSLFRLATTIGTNAVVTGTGDPVGLMVEAGAEESLYGPGEPAPHVAQPPGGRGHHAGPAPARGGGVPGERRAAR